MKVLDRLSFNRHVTLVAKAAANFHTHAICWPRNWRSPWRAASYCLGWTTATLCCTVPRPAAFRSYSMFRTSRHKSFCRRRDCRRLYHSWNSHTGCQFTNALTTSSPSRLTRSNTQQLLHTSATK